MIILLNNNSPICLYSLMNALLDFYIFFRIIKSSHVCLISSSFCGLWNYDNLLMTLSRVYFLSVTDLLEGIVCIHWSKKIIGCSKQVLRKCQFRESKRKRVNLLSYKILEDWLIFSFFLYIVNKSNQIGVILKTDS